MKNVIIYIWFSVGIAALIFATFDFANGFSMRGNTSDTTILSILVTFLVAWQIVQTIASRDEIRKAEIAIKKVSALQDELQLLKDVPDGYLFYTLALIKYGDKKYYDAFEFYSTAIHCFIKNRVDYAKYTTVALSSMVDCIESATHSGDIERFRSCSQKVQRLLTDLEHDVENVNRLVDEAKRKVQAIRNKAEEHGII